ncbi:MAG: enoyl-ACP reductase [Acidobacteriota bacterium]|nr:enoyl-ACP reductase [Acidobacteriota bacterium]MDQ7086899.1 enoyl-ACP reductase [Acidobacteriota bacterium]
MSNLLQGKQGIVFGVANERSYGWHIAKALIDHGAHCAFGVFPGEKMEARARLAIEALELKEEWIHPCDCSQPGNLQAIFEAYRKDHERLDFVIHSIAFADKDYLRPGNFIDTPRESFLQAMDVSVFSLVSMARHAREQMKAGGGGSILAMTYLGAQRAVPGYNAMGVAKAALESSVRYLAQDLGPDNIRVNSISGGPLRTLASSAIKGFRNMLNHDARRSPLQRNVRGEEVGGAAVYLVSDLASGVTGENHFVDCGANFVGF